MKVTAKRSMSYGQKRYAAGDPIEMNRRDAKLLTALGRVSQAEQVSEPAKSKQEEAPKPKGRKGYKRRDMTAEGTEGGAAEHEDD
jgi:ribosomal protein S30